MSTVRLAWRLLMDRRALVSTLSVVVLLCTAAAGTVAIVAAGLAQAQQQSAQLSVPPGRVWAEPLTPAAARVVEGRPSAVRFVDDRAEAVSTAAAPRAVELRLRTSAEALPPLGYLTSGREAREDGEVVVSQAVARTTAVGVGDDLHLPTGRARVVGLAVDPAHSEARFASLVDDASASSGPGTWLLTRDDAALVLEQTQDVNVLGAASVAAQAVGGYQPVAGPPAGTPLLLAAGTAALTATLLALALRGLAPDLRALAAAGMGRRRRGLLALTAGALMLAVSATVGTLLAVLLTAMLRERISGLFGQRWLSHPWPVESLLVVGSVVVVGSLLLAVAFERGLSPEPVALGRRRSILAAVLLAGFGVVGGMVAAAYGARQAAPFIGVLLLNVTVFAVVLASARLLRTRGAAIGRLAAHTGRGLLVLGALTATVVYVCSLTVAREWHIHAKYETNAISESGQRPGALVLRGVGADVASELLTSFERLGGRETTVLGEVLPRAGSVESVSPDLVRCLQADPGMDPSAPTDRCQATTDSATPLGVVFGVGVRLPTDGGPADDAPSLGAREIVQRDQVGLLVFDRQDNFAIEEALTAPAQVENTLGTNMPGVALAPTVARDLQLVPLETRAVYFGDFALLPEDRQAEFRAEVLQRAPAVQPLQRSMDGDDSTIYPEPLPRRVWAWSLGGGAVVLLLLGVTLSGFVQSTGWIRRHLRDLGAPRRVRARVAAAVLAPLAVSVAVGAVAGYAVARVLATERWAAIGFGYHWVLPALAALLAVVAATAAMSRSPRT